MPPGVATAPAPSVRTGVGGIADRPTARQCSAATACASQSVTDGNAFSQSPGGAAQRRSLIRATDLAFLGQVRSERRYCGQAAVVLGTPIVEDMRL